jgi:hypothetical protein
MLRVGARADALYCSGACRFAVYAERKRDEAFEEARRGQAAVRRPIPPHAWMLVAMEILHFAPACALEYRMALVGGRAAATFPPVGGWTLRPFVPPDVPIEGNYRLIWLDEDGEEIPTKAELTMWLSV